MSSKKQLTGLPIVETDDLPSPEGVIFGDLSASTPIRDALPVLRDAGVDIGDALEERQPPFDGVRTMGDLRTVLERREIEGKLGEKLRGILG